MYLYSITNLVELEPTLSADIGFFLLGLITFSLEKVDLSRPNTDALLSVPPLLPCLSILLRSLVKTLALIYILRYHFGVNDGYILALPFAILQKRVLLKSSPTAVQYAFVPRLRHHSILQRAAELKPLPVQKVARCQIHQPAKNIDPMSFLGFFSCDGTRPWLFAGAVMY